MGEVFYRKWRPKSFSEIVGQEHITKTLLSALSQGRVSHAYLFSGPRGTGKTTTGRVLAKAINCPNRRDGEPCNECEVCLSFNEGRAVDLIEIDAASHRRVDDVRDLREKVKFMPNFSKYKVYIIDEVHMLTREAFNALLKTLEEPPPYIVFILATTEPHRVPLTILSRCQRFEFRRLSISDIMKRLKRICELEEIDYDEEALRLIARASSGSLRDAENLLEKLYISGSRISADLVMEELGMIERGKTRELSEAIARGELGRALRIIEELYEGGVDLQKFARQFVEYLRNILLVKGGLEESLELTKEEIEEAKALSKIFELETLSSAIRSFSRADFRYDPQSPLPLELSLLEVIPLKEPAPLKEEKREEKVPRELVEVKRRWNDFINSLRGEGSRGNLDALLRRSCEPVAMDGETIVLGFYYPFHKEKIENPKYKFLVERKLKDFFSHPYKIKCVLIDKKRGEIKEDPVIKEALKEGGVIEE